MHRQPSAVTADDGLVIATGYGLRLYVQRGHLTVEDGLGRDRRTRRFSRTGSQLRRLVVIGHTGYITLDAMRWIRDIGATFVQIDADGTLVTVSHPPRHTEARLLRAQAAATNNGTGAQIMISLLADKLKGQAANAERLGDERLDNRRRTPYATASQAIRAQIPKLNPNAKASEIRHIESVAAKYYWALWARVPTRFDRPYTDHVPEHWKTAGRRISGTSRPRRATTPAHALLNYTYAILEAETVIAAQTVGLDPRIGIFHADRGFHNALAADLMEPIRPSAETIVLDLLETHELKRGDLHETRDGTCRVGRPLAAKLAEQASTLRDTAIDRAKEVSGFLRI